MGGDPGIEPDELPTRSPVIAFPLWRHAQKRQTGIRSLRTGGVLIPCPWALQRCCDNAFKAKSVPTFEKAAALQSSH